MPSSTTVHAYPYPVSGDPFNVPADMQALANALDAGTPVVSATAPTSPPSGLVWYQPAGASAAVLQIWDGSQWQPLVPGVDTGWVNVTLSHSGWAVPSGQVAQMRRIGDEVWGRGYLQHSTFVGGASPAWNLPAGIPQPPTQETFASANLNTNTMRSWTVNSDGSGTVQAYAEAASATFWSLSNIRYRLT